MKKENGELMRLRTVIENDRLNVSSDFDNVIRSDVKSLLNDYFELKNNPTFSVTKNGNVYDVIITAQASRLKPFGVIPKESI